MWKERTSSSKAQSLINSVTTPTFIFSIFCLSDVLSTTLPLSRLLQTTNLDKVIAENLIKDTIKVINNKRSNADEPFSTLFKDVVNILNDLDIQLSVPRQVGRQVYRTNAPNSNPEEFFKISIYLPLLDNVLQDLNSRFDEETFNLFHLNSVMPTNITSQTQQNIGNISEKIVPYIKSFLVEYDYDEDTINSKLKSELELWQVKWHNIDPTEIPESAIKLYIACNEEIFPTVKLILHILCTLPISVASAERSFSVLRRLKTWLRSQIGQDRLSGLALLHIHRHIEINVEDIINRFASSSVRKMEFVL